VSTRTAAQVVHKINRAFREGNLDAVAELLHPDAEIEGVALGKSRGARSSPSARMSTGYS
jgi:hypothetical protein